MSADAAADAFAAATAHWLRASSWVALGEKAMQRDLHKVQKGCPSASPRLRLGPGGDGGWTVCDTAALRAPECAVLSVGVGTDWRFDAATARHYNCSVVMLDPTPSVVDKMRADKKIDQKHGKQEDPHTLFASLPNLRFEPWGLAERDEKLVMNNWWTKYKATDPREMLTLSTIRRRIGGAAAAKPLALLKVDIEGFEWLEMQQNTSRAATAIGTVLEKEPALAHLMAEISAAPPQFEQLCIELHHGTPRAWQLAIRRMLELGFTLAAVEGARLHNGHQPLAELTFVRADGAASFGRPRGAPHASARSPRKVVSRSSPARAPASTLSRLHSAITG